MEKLQLTAKTKIVVLTGAGISAESGLKTFRDNNGLWENHRVEDVATPEAFAEHPAMVWHFYKERFLQLALTAPNPAHKALVQLEDFSGENFTLITQNIDGLHAKAGNKRIIEMHGSLASCFCSKCKSPFQMKAVDLTADIPSCFYCGGNLRPDVVWFGEIPYHMDKISAAMEAPDLFLVIGTSGLVYPAAQLLPIAKSKGAVTVGINLEEPANKIYFDLFYRGMSGEILPDLVAGWIGGS
jgi:NAD-dependent deacetylase